MSDLRSKAIKEMANILAWSWDGFSMSLAEEALDVLLDLLSDDPDIPIDTGRPGEHYTDAAGVTGAQLIDALRERHESDETIKDRKVR